MTDLERDPQPYLWVGRSDNDRFMSAGEAVVIFAPRQQFDDAGVLEDATPEVAAALGTLTYDQWALIGQVNGWVGPAVCSTHDGLPTSETEDQAFEEGDDVCVHILRLYPDLETRDAVEAFHSPSQWRKTPPPIEEVPQRD